MDHYSVFGGRQTSIFVCSYQSPAWPTGHIKSSVFGPGWCGEAKHLGWWSAEVLALFRRPKDKKACLTRRGGQWSAVIALWTDLWMEKGRPDYWLSAMDPLRQRGLMKVNEKTFSVFLLGDRPCPLLKIFFLQFANELDCYCPLVNSLWTMSPKILSLRIWRARLPWLADWREDIIYFSFGMIRKMSFQESGTLGYVHVPSVQVYYLSFPCHFLFASKALLV